MALGGITAGRGLLAGSAFVRVTPDLSGFGARLKTEVGGIVKGLGNIKLGNLDQALKSAGDNAAKVGASLSKSLTLPLLGAGAVAFKFGADFDAVLTRMQGLAGVTADEVGHIRDRLLELSHETGQAPTDLANALYLASSAGLATEEALGVVEVSAKAAAVGMGDAEVVAGALTSTLNAYAKSGLTAAQAADILTAAVKDGAAEADAFAGVIGTVAPLGAQLGVSFDQVAASIAAMTKVGVDTDTAATNLTAIFSGLLRASKTGSEADKALKGVGLSARGLRDDLGKPGGVLTVLNELDKAFGGDEAAMQQVFPEIRALRGTLALLAQDQDSVNQIFRDTADAAGTLDKAFGLAQKTADFKLKRAIADAKVALVTFGEAVAPIGAQVADFAATTFTAFSKLPAPVKTAGVAIGGLLAAAGPVTFLGGKIASGLGSIVTGVKGAATAFSSFRAGLKGIETSFGGATSNRLGAFVRQLGGMPVVLGAVGVGLGLAGLALERYIRTNEEAKQRVTEFTAALQADAGAVGENTVAYVKAQLAQRGMLDDLGKLRGFLTSGRSAFDVLTEAIGGSTDAQKEFRRALLESGQVKLNVSAGDARKVREEWIETGKTASAAGTAFLSGNHALANEFSNLVNDQTAAQNAFRGTADAQRTAADVARDLAAARQKLADLEASGAASADELGAARGRVSALTAEQARIDAALAAATGESTAATEKNTTVIEDQIDALDRLLTIQDAVAKVTDAEANLQDALRDQSRAASDSLERERSAASSLEDAYRGLGDAQRSLLRARQDLAEFNSKAATDIRALERQQITEREVTTPEEVRQKKIDLAHFDEETARKKRDLQDNIADGERRVEDATDRVRDAQRGVQRAAEERARSQQDAAQKVKEAEEGVKRAVEDVEQELIKVRDKGAAAMQPYIEALKKIELTLTPGSPLRNALHSFLADLKAPTRADLERLIPTQTSIVTLSPEYRQHLVEVALGNLPGSDADKAFLHRVGVPGFEHGGVVPGPIGAPMLAKVHGGETITPPGRSERVVVNQTNVFNEATRTAADTDYANRQLAYMLSRLGRST